MKRALIVILLVLIIDQVLKFWIKTHMYIGQEYYVFGDWFLLHFTENEGMAFGMKLGGSAGKLILSIFRIIAIVVIGIYLCRLIQKHAAKGLIISISLIFAGAFGNIIDSAFYGLIFSWSSYHQIATLFPEFGGYGSFLHGKVVDMLYFPLIHGIFPEWLPFWGGDSFIFFRPVFNIADSSITIGVAMLLIFQKRYFGKKKEEVMSREL